MDHVKMKLGPKQQAFLDALKSGKYTQCSGQLGLILDGKERNCCLGVMCRLDGALRNQVGLSVLYAGSCGSLPPEIAERYMLNPVGQKHLIWANDSSHDYAGVIKMIEETPEDIFTGSV